MLYEMAILLISGTGFDFAMGKWFEYYGGDIPKLFSHTPQGKSVHPVGEQQFQQSTLKCTT